MPGRDRLQEIVKESVANLTDEAGQLAHAAENPGQVNESFVAEHARHAHESIDKAADACKILVREG